MRSFSAPHEPIQVKFGLWEFFFMLCWNMVMKILKCKNKNLMTSHFGTLYTSSISNFHPLFFHFSYFCLNLSSSHLHASIMHAILSICPTSYNPICNLLHHICHKVFDNWNSAQIIHQKLNSRSIKFKNGLIYYGMEWIYDFIMN